MKKIIIASTLLMAVCLSGCASAAPDETDQLAKSTETSAPREVVEPEPVEVVEEGHTTFPLATEAPTFDELTSAEQDFAVTMFTMLGPMGAGATPTMKADAVRVAHWSCEQLEAGVEPGEVIDSMVAKITTGDLTELGHAGVGASIAFGVGSFCPDQEQILADFIDAQ